MDILICSPKHILVVFPPISWQRSLGWYPHSFSLWFFFVFYATDIIFIMEADNLYYILFINDMKHIFAISKTPLHIIEYHSKIEKKNKK